MTQNTTIIGFGYRARHGKDSAVAEIVKRYPELTKRYAFADPLRAEVNQAVEACGSMEKLFYYMREIKLPGPGEQVTGNDHSVVLPDWVKFEPNAEVTPEYPYGKQRTLTQWWGTEYRRNLFGQNYWVDKALAKIKEDNVPFALMTDMRFMNEYVACDFTVRVHRPGMPLLEHISEHGLDDLYFDYIILNDKTLLHLQAGAVRVFNEIRMAVEVRWGHMAVEVRS
jgi:hypothetical protein